MLGNAQSANFTQHMLPKPKPNPALKSKIGKIHPRSSATPCEVDQNQWEEYTVQGNH